MSTKTVSGTRYVYRYFHAESGVCITESEARKLPAKLLMVETLRVPGKGKSAEPRKLPLQKEKSPQVQTTFNAIKNTVAVFYNRVKKQLHLLHEKKTDQGLFEVKNPLEGLAPHFPFAVTREVKVVNGAVTKPDTN